MDKLEHPRFRYLVDIIERQVYDVSTAKSSLFLISNLADENTQIRYENTKLKLVLLDIVRDLEKEANKKEPIIIRKDYVEWIKKETKIEEAFK